MIQSIYRPPLIHKACSQGRSSLHLCPADSFDIGTFNNNTLKANHMAAHG